KLGMCSLPESKESARSMHNFASHVRRKRGFDSGLNARKFADKNVENRREKDAEKCYSQHAREDGCAERLTHLGAGSTANHQWYHARDECEGGHQDRA